MDDPNVVT